MNLKQRTIGITGSNFPEGTLYPLWQDFCKRNQRSPDNRVSGIHAGVLNRFDGPDFQGAEVEIDGVRYRGDVEIHLHNQDWFSHGHHLDSRYDQVVLHLVWNHNETYQQPILNSKKLVIPTFSLQAMTDTHPGEATRSMPVCYLPTPNRDLFWSRLQVLALERLLEKGKRMQNQVTTEGKDQTLYQYLLRILGSPNNSDNFQKLASLLPWAELQNLRRTLHPGIEIWLSLFLSVAGQIDQYEHLKPLLEPAGRLSSNYLKPKMPYQVWKVSGQRPWNNPLIRLQGLAHFVHQFNDPSLYQVFRDLFISRLSNDSLLKRLCQYLSPKPSGFWQQRLYRPGIDPKGFWGKSKQTEIIGNVLIPLFYQDALLSGSSGFVEYLEDCYLYLPQGAPYGRLRSYWQWSEFQQVRPKRFYINQALLKIQQDYCQNNSCLDCPLGRIPEKKLT